MISQKMIEVYAQVFNIDLTDGSNVPGVMGSLEMLARGEGEFPTALIEADGELFAPLVDAYSKAHLPKEAEVIVPATEIGTIEVMPEVPTTPVEPST